MKKLILIFLLMFVFITGFTHRRFFEVEHLPLSRELACLQWMKAAPVFSQLKSGDLIFRHGRGFISNALMSFGQREKRYSHAGIVSVEEGNVFVYHAIGGEENKSNKLRKDRLEVFCSAADIHAFGIYRTDFNQSMLDAIILSAEGYFNQGLEFDTKFDMISDDKMYCTEFIYKIFDAVAGNENYISLSTAGGNLYVSCDDLYLNPHSKLIYEYRY